MTLWLQVIKLSSCVYTEHILKGRGWYFHCLVLFWGELWAQIQKFILKAGPNKDVKAYFIKILNFRIVFMIYQFLCYFKLHCCIIVVWSRFWGAKYPNKNPSKNIKKINKIWNPGQWIDFSRFLFSFLPRCMLNGVAQAVC